VIITHTLIIVLDEPNNPRKKKGSNSTFRRKVKTEDAQHLPLDLEPDSPKLRAIKHVERRKRGFRRAAMILMAMSLVALGHAALKETLFQNPRFTLREIKVVSKGMLTESQIQAACGTATGVNLLTVNLHDVRERVMQMPAIRSATVQRDFEGRLTISAQQRQPIATSDLRIAHAGQRVDLPLERRVVAADPRQVERDVFRVLEPSYSMS